MVVERWIISMFENQHQYTICHFPFFVNILPNGVYYQTLIDIDPSCMLYWEPNSIDSSCSSYSNPSIPHAILRQLQHGAIV